MKIISRSSRSAGGQTAEAPVVHLDLLNDDEGGVDGLLQNVEQQFARALDERGLLLGGDRVHVGFGSLAGHLDRNDRHCRSPCEIRRSGDGLPGPAQSPRLKVLNGRPNDYFVDVNVGGLLDRIGDGTCDS
jgi:hypothetical protein